MNRILNAICILSVLGSCQGAPNLLKGLLSPLDKGNPNSDYFNNYEGTQGIDLDNLGNLEKLQNKQGYVQPVYDTLKQAQGLLPDSLYSALPGYDGGNGGPKDFDLFNLYNVHKGADHLTDGLKDLYSTTNGVVGSVYPTTNLLTQVELPIYNNKDYNNKEQYVNNAAPNQVVKFYPGQQLTCVVS